MNYVRPAMRLRSAVSAVLCAFAMASTALADEAKHVDIPPGNLVTALEMLTKQAGVEVIYQSTQLQGIQTHGVSGELQPGEAVEKLLVGTPLKLQRDSSGAMFIAVKPERSALAPRPGLSTVQSEEAAGGGGPESEANLAEVIVTAQKRSEALKDVPTSISVVSGERLQSLHVASLQDLDGYVPGLSVQGLGVPGTRLITMRGLSTSSNGGGGGPTTAVYIDDTPVGPSTGATRGSLYSIDLLPYDLERIEVLAGPQGTLYGADALGGVIKYVLSKPNLNSLEARVGGNLEEIDGSGQLGWAARGALSAPILDGKLAIRLSATHLSNAGWIDNLGTGRRDANHSTQDVGRATILWKPIDELSLQATWLSQNVDVDDATAVTLNGETLTPVFGTSKKFEYFPERNKQRTQFGAFELKWDPGTVELTSSTAYSRLTSDAHNDLSVGFGPATPGHPDALALFLLNDVTSKFVEEIRLASSAEQRLQWLLGGFYTREMYEENSSVPTFTPDYVALPGADNLQIIGRNGDFKEWAAFGNTSYKLTDRFDVGAGLRYVSNVQTGCSPVSAGVFGGGSQPCSSRPYQHKTTWAVDARFHLNTDAMVYGRVSTGYRPGGGCSTCGNSTTGDPGIYGPDTVTNYEAGFKGALADGRLQLNASVFYLKWKDIQLLIPSKIAGISYLGNGGTAASKGLELTSSYAVTSHLRLAASLDYDDAYLTEDALPSGGKSGDQLPSSAKLSGSLLVDYSQPLNSGPTLIVGADYRYKGKVYNYLAHSVFPPPYRMDPQNLIGLHIGGNFDRLETRLYVRNLFNDRSYAAAFINSVPQGALFAPVQPRTVGVSADYRF